MARYILIDNYSGYIWGDSADLEGKIFIGDPVDFAKALDESIGDFGREYEMTHNPPDNSPGYWVYRADDSIEAFAVVNDGQDQETIDAVERDCDEVGFIKISEAANEAEMWRSYRECGDLDA